MCTTCGQYIGSTVSKNNVCGHFQYDTKRDLPITWSLRMPNQYFKVKLIINFLVTLGYAMINMYLLVILIKKNDPEKRNQQKSAVFALFDCFLIRKIYYLTLHLMHNPA